MTGQAPPTNRAITREMVMRQAAWPLETETDTRSREVEQLFRHLTQFTGCRAATNLNSATVTSEEHHKDREVITRSYASKVSTVPGPNATESISRLSVWQPHTKVKTRKGERGWVLQTLLPPTHPPLSVHLSGFPFSAPRSVKFGRDPHRAHPENWLSGIPTVQCTVQAAGTSEVVASFSVARSSASVLTKPAVPGDLTTPAEFVLCVFYPYMTVPDRLFPGLSLL